MSQRTESRESLVSAQWLYDHHNDEDVRIVDASWHLPTTGRDGYAEYQQQHIDGAVFFNIDKHSSDSPLPHMLPSAQSFAQASGELGIAATDTIVVYDVLGIMSAARVWWMYRFFGASNVCVLNGGMPAWLAIDGPVSGTPSEYPQTTFNALHSVGNVANASEVLHASQTGESTILDARSHNRFVGADKEPRAGLRSGHIPGSFNAPFTELLSNGHLRTNDELAEVFRARAIDLTQPIITTCGSGVTAAVIILALDCLGVDHTTLYDGSWSEWGADPALPIATA